jgi:hypothetical protein
VSSGTDPLAGLDRPGGDAASLASMGSTYVSGSEALGHTARALAGMVGRLLAQSWSGQAAMACASACTRNATMVAAAADAYQIGGAALQRYAHRLAAAQADYDAARKLAHQAVTDEKEHEKSAMDQAATGVLVNPLDLFWTSPLRLAAQSRAQQAIRDAKSAAKDAAGTLDETLAPFRPKPAPPAPKPEHHWYSPVTNFGDGVWDGVKDPVVMVGGLVGLHGDVSDNWSALGGGLWHGVTNPLDLGKGIIGWDDLSNGRYAHWAGNLLPGAVAAFYTGGAAAAVKGSDGLAAVSRSGKALADMSEAEKATLLARGEKLVPGSVGADATAAERLAADGRIDYSRGYEDELKNFRTIQSSGEVTLKEDLWLNNIHDANTPLSDGRSYKYATPPDEILNHSRGGALQRLALLKEWQPRTGASVIKVPAGTTVHMTEGTTSAQMSQHTLKLGDLQVKVPRPTGFKVGGGTQVLFKDFDRNWVLWTGKAPWPSTSEVLPHALKVGSAAGLTVRAPDVMADLAQDSGP